MSPPIPKDWWLAAALTGAALPSALTQAADTVDRQTGVVTSVTQGATRGSSSTPIYIENTRGQRLVTGPNQTMHVLFSDQSAITVGPNSEVKIAEYKYDAQAKDGNILLEMTKGVFRVVGGLLSKKRDTMVRTTTATIGIRGGITVVENSGGQTRATFLFGQHMRMSNSAGDQSQTVTRPGFGVTSNDGRLSSPIRIPTSDLSGLLARLEPRTTPAAPTPTLTPSPSSVPENLQISNIAPDRVGTPSSPTGVPRPGNVAPTLRDILGTQSAGNQS